jgi:pimeloyl-ACP methyl ester carboxylesterase
MSRSAAVRTLSGVGGCVAETTVNRREFLRAVGLGAAGATLLGQGAIGAPIAAAQANHESVRAASQGAIQDGLDPAKLHFVDVDGVRTRYYEDGSGEPMLLIHGGGFGPGYSLDAWSLAIPILARSFHVYAIDRLGQGQTDNPLTQEDYTFDGVQRHLLGFMRTVGLRQVHLVGHSRGGLFGAHVALKQPDLVKTLVLVDSSTLSGDDPPFYGTLRQVPGPSRESVRVEPEAQSYSWDHITDDWVTRLVENATMPKTLEAQRAVAQGLSGPFNASLRAAREEAHELLAAGGFSMPTLIIWAYNDVSAFIDEYGYPLLERIASTTPWTEFHVINQSGHYVFREQAATFAKTLRGFCLG